MAQFNVSVTSTAAVIVTGQGQYGNETAQIFNPPTSGVTAYLSNNTGVTTTTGFALTPGSTITWYNPPTAGCSAITAANQQVSLVITQNIS
jgi:hypothetical protein